MKIRFFFIYFFIFTNLLFCSCLQNNNEKQRVAFMIGSTNFDLLVPINLDEGLSTLLTFDTAAPIGAFVLDSTYLATHSFRYINKDVDTDTILVGSSWSTHEYHRTTLRYKSNYMVKIGNLDLMYDHIDVTDWKEAINNKNTNGLFNIPQSDSVHVWELNFESNYLEIHSVEAFKMPQNALVFSMIKDPENKYPFHIQIPMQIEFSNGDTLTVDRTFLIDTGVLRDISLLSQAEELGYFNNRDGAVWTAFADNYYRHYNVKTIKIQNLTMDSLRIYTFDRPNYIRNNYILGLNFLKRFNVFFDLKNNKIGLQPINNYCRIVNPNRVRYHLTPKEMPDGRVIVSLIGNYEGNYYKTAGLREGDELVSLNKVPFKDVTHEKYQEFLKQDTLMFDIIRKGKSIQLLIPIDKNEVQGD